MIFTSWTTPLVKEEKSGNTDCEYSLDLHKLFHKSLLKWVQKIEQLTLLERKITEDGQCITPPILPCAWILIFVKHSSNTALSLAITTYKLLNWLKRGWGWSKGSEIIPVIQAHDTLFQRTKRKHSNALQCFSQAGLWNPTLRRENTGQEAGESLLFCGWVSSAFAPPRAARVTLPSGRTKSSPPPREVARSPRHEQHESGLPGRGQPVRVAGGPETEPGRTGERQDPKIQCQRHPLLSLTCKGIPDGSSRHEGLPSTPAHLGPEDSLGPSRRLEKAEACVCSSKLSTKLLLCLWLRNILTPRDPPAFMMSPPLRGRSKGEQTACSAAICPCPDW